MRVPDQSAALDARSQWATLERQRRPRQRARRFAIDPPPRWRGLRPAGPGSASICVSLPRARRRCDGRCDHRDRVIDARRPCSVASVARRPSRVARRSKESAEQAHHAPRGGVSDWCLVRRQPPYRRRTARYRFCSFAGPHAEYQFAGQNCSRNVTGPESTSQTRFDKPPSATCCWPMRSGHGRRAAFAPIVSAELSCAMSGKGVDCRHRGRTQSRTGASGRARWLARDSGRPTFPHSRAPGFRPRRNTPRRRQRGRPTATGRRCGATFRQRVCARASYEP